MAKFAIINMKANRHLCAFNHLVGHTSIIRVQLEADICQTPDKLAVVEQTCDHGSVESIRARGASSLATMTVAMPCAAVSLLLVPTLLGRRFSSDAVNFVADVTVGLFGQSTSLLLRRLCCADVTVGLLPRAAALAVFSYFRRFSRDDVFCRARRSPQSLN